MKRRNSKSLPFLAIFYLLCFYQVHAQNNPYNEVSIASPTAAALGKYVDVPVNNHTGIPQISIPIYTIKEGPLQLPISLSYHAGGLKVMEPASWVGAGWSLNAGGVITRTVQGAPDERMTSSVDNQDKGHFSNYGFNSYLYEGVDMNGKPLAYWQPFAEGRKDGEPDLFFFNFAGYSGKFFFRDDRTPVLVPEQDIKIVPDYTGSGSIQSFTLTTPDGVKYYFGKTPSTLDTDPIEKTNPFTAQGGLSNGNVISSWYLNKIVSADDLFAINLTYSTENYGYYTLSMYPLTGDDMFTLTTSGSNFEYNLVKNIVNGVRLSSISFSNGSLSFTASTARDDLSNTLNSLTPDSVNTEAKRLGAIDISDNNGFCKKYAFSYSYFDDNTTPLKGYFSNYYIQTDRKRLKLDSLQEKSCDGTVSNPPHVFEYFSELVPRRLSFGQDHWGFYNGVATNNSLIPTYTVNESTTVSGANRDASWPAMRGGALKKITYPTGGLRCPVFHGQLTCLVKE